MEKKDVVSEIVCIFAPMNQLKRCLVWLARLHRCRGFGIQSPTDYAFVRYVVNEHWPYYAYATLTDKYWLKQKLGRFYFRLANWRQPQTMLTDDYLQYFKAGCKKTQFVVAYSGIVDLARVDVENYAEYESLLARCDARSVLVVEGIWRDRNSWRTMEQDIRTGTTFDLYYCGIIFFDKHRSKHNYQINF